MFRASYTKKKKLKAAVTYILSAPFPVHFRNPFVMSGTCWTSPKAPQAYWYCMSAELIEDDQR